MDREYWTMGLVVGMILLIIGVIGMIFLDDKAGIYPYFCIGATAVMIVPSIIHLFVYHQYHQNKILWGDNISSFFIAQIIVK